MNQLTDWFEKWAAYSPDKIALKQFETGETISYSQLNDYGYWLYNLCKNELGLEKGDRIAVVAENSIFYVALLSLAQKSGYIIAPLNYRLTSQELDSLLETLAPAAIFYDEKYREKLDACNNKPATTQIKSIEKIHKKWGSGHEPLRHIEPETVHPDETALIIFTSGTTGKPKGSQYTHKMMFWNSINTQLRLDITSADRSINCAPPFHTGGWNVLLTPFLHHGAYTLIMKSFDADLVLKSLVEEAITLWWAVPTMLKIMSSSTLFEKVKPDKLRYFVVGGEAMPVPLIEVWNKKGIPIRQGYGLTEVGPNVTSLNEEHVISKKGSIGKANFYYEIRLVHESGQICKRGEAGELWLKGPAVSPGYWKNPEGTHANMSGEWFKTGDVMIEDEDGFLFVVDRLKYMYISGGENVYPAEVEGVLRQMFGVSDVAVIGVKDEQWGETGKAFIILETGAQLEEKDVVDFCLKSMAKYKIPKHFVFVKELPRNDAGKVDRKKLKEQEAKK